MRQCTADSFGSMWSLGVLVLFVQLLMPSEAAWGSRSFVFNIASVIDEAEPYTELEGILGNYPSPGEVEEVVAGKAAAFCLVKQ